MTLSSLPRQEKMDKKAQHKIIQCLKAFMNNKVILVLNVILRVCVFCKGKKTPKQSQQLTEGYLFLNTSFLAFKTLFCTSLLQHDGAFSSMADRE